MPRGIRSLYLRLLREDGRRRLARHCYHGAGGSRRFYRTLRELRRFIGRRHSERSRRDFRSPRRHQQVAPTAPNRLRAGPAAPLLETDGNVDPALASPPPMKLPPLVSHFPDAPRVQVRADDALAFVSAATGASSFVFGSGTATVDAVAVMRPPSPTLEAPPSPRADVRRRLAALVLPLSSPASASPSSSRGRRSETWSPAALELSNSRADGAAPGTRFPGDSSDEGIRGRSTSGRR
jgi:hypothetical protein